MALPAETDLIARARNGDVDAFCFLVSEHRRVMYALALRFSGNHYDAEDLVQEVFLNAYRAISRFRGGCTFHTWLRRIMVNSFLSHKRKKVLPQVANPDESPAVPDTEAGRVAFNHVVIQQILQHLEAIPSRQRLMFIMKYQEGLTCEEIGQYFGTSVGTVKKTVFRVVERLRKEFHTAEVRLNEGGNARLSEIP